MSLLEIRHISKRYGNFLAIDDVSFDVNAGEFFSLVGTSGCGKTTLLRLISGLDIPDEGDILLEGKSLLTTDSMRRPFHTVFQSYALFPHLSVAENVGFPLRMLGWSGQAVKSRVSEVLELVALRDKLNNYPHELSGGQRQRVALARAIADLPQVLLLDEPLAALDAKLREQMQVELIRLQRDLGITFIFVTHSQIEALALSHRIGVMNQGKLVQLDTPEHIYGYPKNKFVAEFIGHCAMISVTVQASDGNHVKLNSESMGVITAPLKHTTSTGTTGWLMLRPEQVRIGRPGTFPDFPNRVAGKVRDFLYIGDVTSYIVELATGTRMEALLANSAPGRVHFFEEGESVELAWSADTGLFLYE